ncbi:MAG: hypothetical protein WCQ47_08290 [bacterium]
MENTDKKCLHKVRFVEKQIDPTINVIKVGENYLYADCILCKSILNDEEIRTSLKSRYELKIAKVIYQLFRYRKAYNVAISKLEKNEILNPPIKEPQ